MSKTNAAVSATDEIVHFHDMCFDIIIVRKVASSVYCDVAVGYDSEA
jgi:hypothetical protein